jgi:hypothetical protein
MQQRGELRTRWGGPGGKSVLFAVALVAACDGSIGNHGVGSGGSGGPAVGALAYGPTGLHRLSRIEYDNTLADLLGDKTRSGFASLPEDVSDPFDNDFSTQLVSGALIASAESLAAAAATRALADPTRRSALVGCTPSGAGDQGCLETFVRAFGRRAFRRPLTDEEVAGYLGLSAFAVEANDFYVGVELVLRALLQDPSFLYRVEVGTAVAGKDGLYRLGDYEIGARLSYFLWGSTPPDRLLDMAASGALSTESGRRAAATELLADPRGVARIQQFHAFWLAYDQLPLAADIAAAMRAETDALVARVVFERRGDYFDLFNATETFVNDTLAAHYGLPLPGSTTGAWVAYGANPRRGILSHGTLLAAGAKFDDTSPTLRGVFVRNRLLCQTIPPPPPTVAVDQPPPTTSSPCKVDRYAAHRSGGCAGCHNQTDPIGFGLENYDRTGAYRTADKDNPQCTISGDGEVVGLGTFNGPAELASLIAGSGNLESCLVTQLYRMALGRREADADAPTLAKFTDGFKQNGRAFDKLLVDLVADPAFIHRQLEP